MIKNSMAPQLRFCFVTTFYPPYNFGGDGIFVYRLANELAGRGHQVEIIHCIDAYKSLESRVNGKVYQNHPDIKIHGLKSQTGFLSPLWTHQFGSPGFKNNAIRKILGNGKFDVIHFHNISLVGGPKILEYGKAVKLYTMHEYWLVCPTHVLFKFDRKACIKRSCLACSLSYKRPPQLWRLTGMLQKAVKHIDAFIAPSRFAAEMHKKMGLDLPTEHIPSFIPKPPTLKKTNEVIQRPYFLFAGRIKKLKGLQNIIPIFKEYKHADLLIAGKGAFSRQLKKLAAGHSNIKFLGLMPFEKLLTYYAGAIALLVPSLCYETFGQIVVEAYAMKTPVIVHDIGALGELVNESGGGYTYQEDSELVAIMDKLRTNAGLREKLGQEGFSAYLKNWTADQHIHKYLNLIAKLQKEKA